MAKHRIEIGDINANAVKELTEDDVRKITGGALSLRAASDTRTPATSGVRWTYVELEQKT